MVTMVVATLVVKGANQPERKLACGSESLYTGVHERSETALNAMYRPASSDL